MEAKHIAINDTVKYLRITEEVEKLIDGKLVTVDSDLEDDFEIGNYFVDFSFSENTITMLKNSNDFIYYAKKASEKNKEKILSKVLKLDKKYAMENNELIEYPDGYIELKPFFMDHIFQDLDEIKKDIDQHHPDIYLYGHTHLVKEQIYNNCLILNPGSITLPRDDWHGSYIILTIDKKVTYKVVRINVETFLNQYQCFIE